MAAAGLDQFADYLKSLRVGEFTVKPIYEPRSDSLLFYIRNERSYSKRINQLMTLFLSAEDDTLVGCEVKGVKRMLRRVGQFAVGVWSQKDKRLQILLAFAMAPEPEVPEEDFSDELLRLHQAAEGVEFDAPEFEACGASG